MTWKTHKDLSEFPDGIFRLHFWLEKAELYSFRFDDAS
jgi:hypothetical protein